MVAVAAEPGRGISEVVLAEAEKGSSAAEGGLAEDKSGEGKRRQAWLRPGKGIAEAVTGGPDRQGRGYGGAELSRE